MEKKMADKEEEKKEEAGVKKKGNMLLYIIIGVVALLLLVGVGIGAYFLGSKSASPTLEEGLPAEEGIVEQKPARPAGKKIEELGSLVQIDEFLINLLDKDSSRYLKATLTLEMDSGEAAAEIQTRMPQIRDAILLLTSSKTFGELQDLQGKMQLRAELIGHLNTLLAKGQVKHIYITNFVIQ
jgi:flagellar FliL protein